MNWSERISRGRASDFVTHVSGSRRFKRCLSKEFVVENLFVCRALVEHKIDSRARRFKFLVSWRISVARQINVSVLFEKIASRRSIDDLTQELWPWLSNENSLKI